MITVEEWTTIRCLHAQGKSIRQIAEDLHLSRNTVRAALRDERPPKYTRATRANPQLDPFADQIAHMALAQEFIGSRILRELRGLGYRGGPTALYDRLRTLKAGKQDSRVSERFETPPAQQAQFDWSPYTISLGERLLKVYVYGLTLAFSRRKLYWPSLDETQASAFEAIEASLRACGGAPKHLLVDNARVFVDRAHPAQFAWNTHFLEFCGHYAIEPRACQPGRPRTKGKVERPFFYLEQHFIKGHTWQNFDAFARDLATFVQDDLDVRVHATTGERPIDRFQQEAPLLTPLPALPFVGTHEEMRKVSWDCLLSFAGTRYSVPWPYAGKHVWLRPSQGTRLLVRSQRGEEIARHTLAIKKGATVIDAAHYAGLRQGLPRTRVLLEATFSRLFPDHGWFLEALFIQHRTNGLAHLRAILGLAELYTPEALQRAFANARAYNTYSHRFIRGVLEAEGASQQQPPPVLAFRPPSTPVRADLAVYQRVLEAGR
jgi:transposase